MSSHQIVIQLTVTVDGDGAPCVKIDAPASPTAPTPAPPPCGGGGGSPPPPSPPAPPPGATAVAQRVVHLVGGNGGLAWFTLIWPAPDVINDFVPAFAYDNPANAGLVPGTDAAHPLFARKIGPRLLWDGTGKHPEPTVFVAGSNQTHTNNPQTTVLSTGIDVIAAGTVIQAGLGAALPVLVFAQGPQFGPAPGAPAPAVVASIDAAIVALRAVTSISAALEADLRPSAATLAGWGIDGSTPQVVADLARTLLFTANVFRHGLVSTVLMRAFNDDPHGAFAGGDAFATARADQLARVLDGFYAELALHTEPNASTTGTPLSLADNVVLLVSGDTPKNSFDRNGWSDGTVGAANLLYVRSNGFLKPGWFGRIAVNGRSNFDPTTGVADTSTLAAVSTTAAQLGILDAITRGNVAAVTALSPAPFAGVVATTPP